MKVKTQFQGAPLRIVGGFTGHSVGGVGTPYQLKGYRYIEVACFAAGCNFRCPQCQNWTTTYLSKAKTLRPREAAEAITHARKSYAVDRMAISGGESTLNRKWLLEYVREVRALDPALQVCVLDYRPQFRRMDLHHPSYDEMLEVYGVLKDVGMEVVICQTLRGYIGP